MPARVASLIATWCLGLSMALVASGAAQARNRAVLVGVSDYKPPIEKLKAPGRDVKRVWDFLTEHQFAAGDVAVLADDKVATQGIPDVKRAEPTAANILKALDELIGALRQSNERGKEFVVFYFSGHGTYHREDRTKKTAAVAPESDGNDEALLALDAGEFDTVKGRIPGSILDDELKDRFDQLQKLAFVWVIIDSCHAGGATRGASDEIVYKSIDPATLKAPVADPPSTAGEVRKQSEWIADGGGATALVSFLAVGEDAKAIEKTMPAESGAARASLFTHYLLTAMRQSGLTTYRQLANEVQSLIARDGANNPQPTFLGELDRELDGGAVTWSIEAAPGAISVNAGQLAGLAKGTILALERRARGRLDIIGYARVTEAGALRSTIEPIDFKGLNKPDAAALQSGATASVTRAVVSFELTVAKPQRDACRETKGATRSRETETEKAAFKASLPVLDEAVRQLSAKGAAGFPVRFVEAGQPALVRLCLASDVVYYVGSDGGLDFGPRRATPGRRVEGAANALAAGLSEDLWRIVRQQNLLRVAGETASSPIGAEVDVSLRLVRGEGGASGSDPEKRDCAEFSRLPGERAGRELRPATIGGSGKRSASAFVTFGDRITHCDRIVVEVRNNSEHDVDITLLYLDASGSIGRVGREAEARVPKGQVRPQIFAIDIVTWCPTGKWAECREEERKSARADTYAPVGTERLAVVVARASGPSRVYYYLAQPGLNRAPERTRGNSRGDDAFDTLLRDAAMTGETATRGIDAGGDAAIKIFQWEVVPPAELKRKSR